MPELPEVETIRIQTDKILPLKIKSEEMSDVIHSLLKDQDRDFSPIGKTIVATKRKGKLLGFRFNDETYLLSHLGMSGSWRISKEKITEKHTHLQLMGEHIGEKIYLAFVDPRRFGNLYFYSLERAQKKFESLGVDIASEELTADYIYRVFKRYPERKLKVFLLDQKFFSGVGNYIASEICARAGIRPTRRCGKITKKEIKKIKMATKKVLNNSLKGKGTTFSGGYKDTTGNDGGGLKGLMVFYQKTCQICGKTPVKKIVLAQRGTYYCPKCQR